MNYREKLSKLEEKGYATLFERIAEGYIFEKETIYNALNYFIRVDNVEKANFIAGILNKYYDGYINEKINELIGYECYEMCDKLKKFVK